MTTSMGEEWDDKASGGGNGEVGVGLGGRLEVPRLAMAGSPLMALRTADPPHLKQRTGRLFRSRRRKGSLSSPRICLLEITVSIFAPGNS